MIISEKVLREIILLAIDMRDQGELEFIIEGFASRATDMLKGQSAAGIRRTLSDEDDAPEGGYADYSIDVPDGVRFVYPLAATHEHTPHRVPPCPDPRKSGCEPSPKRKNPVDGKNRPHKGYDIRAPSGQPVVSVAKGSVAAVGNSQTAGLFIVISHAELGAGMNHTAYMHLSQIKVGKGVVVSPGQLIGYVGSTGRSTGPHLHFSMGNTSNTLKHSHEKLAYDRFLNACEMANATKIESEKKEDDAPDGQVSTEVKPEQFEASDEKKDAMLGGFDRDDWVMVTRTIPGSQEKVQFAGSTPILSRNVALKNDNGVWIPASGLEKSIVLKLAGEWSIG